MNKFLKRSLYIAGAATAGGTALFYWPVRMDQGRVNDDQKIIYRSLPSKEEQLKRLHIEQYDVLVIGGGATGCGIALDAQTRGLKTALVEKFDFASGTSSRSTKLIHGGVRYLQKAIMNFDIEQYKMVREALSERANLLEIAPHLAQPLPIMLPIYKWWQIPYYWAGIKAYDVVAGFQILRSSYFLSKSKTLEEFPMLKGKELKGSIVYYDGQHEDARMCLTIAMTAARRGAAVANYLEVVEILKERVGDSQKACGARVKDTLTGEQFNISAKCVINATGPCTDRVRSKDLPGTKNICQPSSGIHVILPDYYSPMSMGLLDPSTSDGRIIFFLPWQNSTMAGTTDTPCNVTDSPEPKEEEIKFILEEIRNYLSSDVSVRRGDVLSVWSGIRPLVLNPLADDTQSIARNHVIEVSESNMITIAGGKWTTYRRMAEETVDKAISVCGLHPSDLCKTKGLKLDGADNWTANLFIQLIQDFGFESYVAKHICSTYGDKAYQVAELAALTGKRWPIVGKKLHQDFPYIEAEVKYAVREYACTAVDVLARRTRLAFLNVQAAEEALPRVIEILAKELGWSKQRKIKEHEDAIRFLKKEMGLNLKCRSQRDTLVDLSRVEITHFLQRFRTLDYNRKGYVTLQDLKNHFKKTEENVTEEYLQSMMKEVDCNNNGQIDEGEFLQLMSCLKKGTISNSAFASTARKAEGMNQPIPIQRSGGGV